MSLKVIAPPASVKLHASEDRSDAEQLAMLCRGLGHGLQHLWTKRNEQFVGVLVRFLVFLVTAAASVALVLLTYDFFLLMPASPSSSSSSSAAAASSSFRFMRAGNPLHGLFCDPNGFISLRYPGMKLQIPEHLGFRFGVVGLGLFGLWFQAYL